MKRIVLHEVGPRDGLQMEKQVVPTDTKEAWIRRLMAVGVDIVQVGSFVHPEKVPQMADTDELFRRLTAGKTSATVLSGLVLNEKGLERGLACGVEMFCLGASASETHSRKNTGMGSHEATQRIVGAAKQAVSAGKKVQVSVQSAFGCGFDGPVPEHRVLDMVRAYLEAGLRNISLADTAGHADPAQVERDFAESAEAIRLALARCSRNQAKPVTAKPTNRPSKGRYRWTRRVPISRCSRQVCETCIA